jgi:hypothetical protein
MNATVKLADGSTMEATDSEWPEVCSPTVTKTLAPSHVGQKLTVRKHADGRYLVYGSLELRRHDDKQHDGSGGIIVLPGGNVASVIAQVARDMQLDELLVEGCLKQLNAR